MAVNETIRNAPIMTEKTIRREEIRALTSGRAGKILPVYAVPLLREDGVKRGRIDIQLKMEQTIHTLMNSIGVTAYVHFVPFTAFERFRENGLSTLNRAYKGEPEPSTGQVVPYFHKVAYDNAQAFWNTLGIHWPQGDQINSAYLEAYNTVVNFRRQARSAHLPERDPYDTTLAEAFWKDPEIYTIVPDFNQAALDGEVELQWVTPKLHISGVGLQGGPVATQSNVTVTENGQTVTYQSALPMSHANLRVKTGPGGGPAVFAELESAGISLSLANIELAKKTAAFAKLRKEYDGLDDDHIIDLLMEGIRVPDEAMKQPMLLDRVGTIFGYTERNAMDGASLDVSRTDGRTGLSVNFRLPPMNTGGVILVTLEIVPEQLFERRKDRYLEGDVASLPNFMRDFADPEKVTRVSNDYVDVLHSVPDGTFGYAPLNHHWNRSIPRIGGRYMRAIGDPYTEDRQRFWAVEQIDPSLTQDFYLCPQDFPHTVFADMLADPFEVLSLGSVAITGNTVFGRVLEEDTGDYEKIMDQMDTSRIDQDGE